MDEYRLDAVYDVRPEDTAFDDIFRNAETHPDHPACRRPVDGGWAPVGSKSLAADVEAVAAGLVVSDIEPGQRIGLMARTSYEWFVIDAAIMSVGAVTVPIYETSSPRQIEWILRDSGAVAVWVESSAHAATVESLRQTLPELREVWCIDIDRPRLIEAGLAVNAEMLGERRDAVRAADIATIVYTSGTTGNPKGCTITHGNLVAVVRNVMGAEGIEQVFNERESTLLFLPLAHVLARVIQYGAINAHVEIGHLGDLKQLPETLPVFGPTTVLSVPRVFEKIYNSARLKAHGVAQRRILAAAVQIAVAYSQSQDRGGPDLLLRVEHQAADRLVYRKIRAAMGGHVRWAVSGGAPLGARLGHFFRGIGVTVLEGYGLTESTAGATLNLPGCQRIGSVGRPIPGSSVRIAPDGEVLLKGPHIFAGYWNNETATAEVFDDDGWFHTGDIGRLDADGFLYITDRMKDLIVTAAGKNVAPAGLEDRLRAHWLISQAFVFGDARPYIAALLTVEAEAFIAWKRDKGMAEDATVTHLPADGELRSELQRAVDEANSAVSQAESIRRWAVLEDDFSEALEELTPTLKMRRKVIAEKHAHDVEALYS
jgi:long-chain acyl-CoA synthetase